MSAAELRKAAKTLREKADALRDHSARHGEITGGPDSWWSASFLANAIAAHAPGTADDSDLGVLDEHYVLAGEWLALITTRVGLALADWLDDIAAGWMWDGEEPGVVDFDGDRLTFEDSLDTRALALARLVNGGAS